MLCASGWGSERWKSRDVGPSPACCVDEGVLGRVSCALLARTGRWLVRTHAATEAAVEHVLARLKGFEANPTWLILALILSCSVHVCARVCWLVCWAGAAGAAAAHRRVGAPHAGGAAGAAAKLHCHRARDQGAQEEAQLGTCSTAQHGPTPRACSKRRILTATVPNMSHLRGLPGTCTDQHRVSQLLGACSPGHTTNHTTAKPWAPAAVCPAACAQVMGCAMMLPLGVSPDGSRVAEIGAFCVDVVFRGTGRGDSLLDYVEQVGFSQGVGQDGLHLHIVDCGWTQWW